MTITATCPQPHEVHVHIPANTSPGTQITAYCTKCEKDFRLRVPATQLAFGGR